MSIADKLLYLNETKTALADAINVALSARGEPPLDANATFRSYAERLFYPGYLFGRGEQGTYSLPPNPDSYFTDTAGTTPAALTDAVALVQGEVGPDWTQGTAKARPRWAREPEGGRRNFINRNTDMFLSGGSAWQYYGITQQDMDARQEQEDGWAYFEFSDPATVGVRFICKNFTVALGQPYSLGVEVQVIEGSAGMRISLQKSTSGSGPSSSKKVFAQGETGILSGENLIEDSDTVSGIKIWWYNQISTFPLKVRVRLAQAELGSALTPLQRVASELDVTEAGVPDVPYVRFDLADDVLTTTLPAATYTVVLPTRQGIWIDSVAHAGGAFSIGPTTYTGGPAGILTALESDGVCKMIAPPLVIDRALSAGERNGLVRWYQARGAGELLEVFP